MSANSTIDFYDAQADGMAAKFLSLSFEQAHPGLARHFPHDRPMAVADIGAGAGRDALALAGMGHHVMAVEPSAGLRARGQAYTKDSAVVWADDRLPELPYLTTYPQRYDFILCNAVWMHLTLPERAVALQTLARLLTPTGRIYIKAFDGAGQARPGRPVYAFHPAEFLDYAPPCGLRLAHQEEQKDLLGKPDLCWYAVRLDAAAALNR